MFVSVGERREKKETQEEKKEMRHWSGEQIQAKREKTVYEKRIENQEGRENEKMSWNKIHRNKMQIQASWLPASTSLAVNS